VITVVLSLPGVAKALALGTTREPARFTELYFSNPTALPKAVKARQAATFSYHISNDEATNVTYMVKVTETENGVAQALSQGPVTIAAGAGADIPVSFSAPAPGMSLELEVELPDQHESIYFRSHS
jgi:hypothetical protein